MKSKEITKSNATNLKWTKIPLCATLTKNESFQNNNNATAIMQLPRRTEKMFNKKKRTFISKEITKRYKFKMDKNTPLCNVN